MGTRILRRRRLRRCARLSCWLGVHWRCRCRYFNANTDRCFCCGRRPPARLRSVVEHPDRLEQIDLSA